MSWSASQSLLRSRGTRRKGSAVGLALLSLGLSIGTALAASGDLNASSAAGGRQFAGFRDGKLAAGAGPRAKRHRKRCPRRHQPRRHLRRKFKPTPPRCPADPTPARIGIHRGTRTTQRITNGPYPPSEPPPTGEFGDPGEEATVRVPAGRFIRAAHHATEPAPSGGEVVPGEEGAARASSAGASTAGDIEVVRNRSLKTSSRMPVASSLGDLDGGEQSVAKGGKAVLYTTNRGDAISTDGGYSFSYLDPAKIFPAAAGGFCCDQVVTYLPRQRRFVWVLQYWSGKGGAYDKYAPNAILVATARLADVLASNGTSWSFYTFTPDDFGFSLGGRPVFKRYWPNLDRPHVAFTGSNLYLTASAFGGASHESFRGTALWRIGLSQLGKGSIGYQWIHLGPEFAKVRPAQSASPRARTQYFAGAATTSRLDVLEWGDQSNPAYVHEVDVPSIATEDTASRSNSGANWMERWGKSAGQVETGAQVGNTLVFGWMAGRKAKVIRDGKVELVSTHDQPALEFAFINTSVKPLRRVAQLNVEFANYAAALPQLRANTDGALALSFVFGGPSGYASHAVGFLVGWASALTVSGQVDGQAADIESNPGPIEAELGGDYVGLASDPNQPQCFVAAGAASKLRFNDPNPYVDPHYIVFGRRAAHCKVTVPPFVPLRLGPDLVVSRVYAVSNSQLGTFQVKADVTNIGNAAAPQSFTGITPQGGQETPVFTFAIPPGGTTTVGYPCAYGTPSATARADATNVVDELNEANNSGASSPEEIFCRFP
jgi:hypothetical protein